MNSQQRRKDRRRWRYSVTTYNRDYGHYRQMWNWLAERHGIINATCGWRERHPIAEPDPWDYGFETIW